FTAMVEGLADGCRALEVPVVGGNVSLYNDSAAGPVPPTPTLAMVGTKSGYDAPPMAVSGGGEGGQGEGRGETDLVLVGGHNGRLGGSIYLDEVGGADRVPDLPEEPSALLQTLASVADQDEVQAVHDVSDGGLAVTLAEMVTEHAGIRASVPDRRALFSEAPGRVVVETTDKERLGEEFRDVATVETIGTTDASGRLAIEVETEDATVQLSAEDVAAARSTLDAALE
ncbi:MAG: AIR synthase-related protein, partial [Halodesulfurarchaeum sp.]